MATQRLTSKFVESVKPTDGRQAAYPDAQVPGLELRVSPGGRKVWSFRYRTKEGRQRRMTLGIFPSVDLGDARDKAFGILSAVSGGGDPAGDERKSKDAARAQSLRTFNDLADAYLDACERGEWMPKGRRKRKRTLDDERNILRRHVRQALGTVALEDISRASIKRVLRGMLGKGIGAQTNRAHAVMRQCFAWAIAEERLEANPATGFAPLAAEAPRARVVTDEELRAIWSTLKSPAGVKIQEEGEEPRSLYLSRPVAIVLQLAALLLQRRAEIAGMRRSEVNLEEATWLIPAERTKGGRPHLVPLPARAVELIREAMELSQAGREKPPACIFPGRRDGSKAIRPDSVTHALADVAKACAVEGITVHDLRRTGASALASERLSVAPFLVSRVLGHNGDTGGAAAVTLQHYAVYDFAPEKRRALEAWEGLLLEITGERARPPKLVAIHGAR